MGLRSLRLPEAKFQLANGDHFSVRGLSLPDVSKLAEKHGPVMAMLYQRFVDVKDEDMDSAKMFVMGKAVMEIAPDFAVALIAHAADEPDAVDVVARLPFPLQIEALNAVFRLTFTSEEQWGNVLEIVVNALEKGMQALNQAKAPMNGLSLPGFEGFAAPSAS